MDILILGILGLAIFSWAVNSEEDRKNFENRKNRT